MRSASSRPLLALKQGPVTGIRETPDVPLDGCFFLCSVSLAPNARSGAGPAFYFTEVHGMSEETPTRYAGRTLKAKEVAAILRVHENTVRMWIRKGILEASLVPVPGGR